MNARDATLGATVWLRGQLSTIISAAPVSLTAIRDGATVSVRCVHVTVQNGSFWTPLEQLELAHVDAAGVLVVENGVGAA